ncbi:MAG TPA: aminotransferase class I/II-fold pyridoxal phosphate-dependent enzyme [Polyangia bacterium]|jgi:aspartate/methionine/tyrosine aminotransferase
MIAQRIHRIGFSPTLRISAQATKMRQQGVDIADFSVGEPDFPTPEFIKAAAKKALDQNLTKYTPNAGTLDLRKAICEKLRNENNVEYQPDEIISCSGAKAALYEVSQALFDEGDDVLIPTPYWVTYPEQVRMAGAHPVFVPTREEHGFRLQPEDLKQALSARTKALILCHPHNPTGATYGRADLEALVDICVSEGIYIISDEIYEKLVYDGFRNTSIASLSPKAKALTVTINGASKAYAMTGWRLGWAAGPRDVIAAVDKVQSHLASNPSSIAQAAYAAALRGPQSDLLRMAQEFQRRRTTMVYRLRALPGVSCHDPKGAFYAFPHVASYFDREYQGTAINNSYGLAYYLLKFGRVAVVPGDAFGAPDYVRLSFATSMERIETGLARMREALANLTVAKRGRRVVLNNTATKVKQAAEVEPSVDVMRFAELRREAESRLNPESYFEWNASIAGMVIQLRTNSPHLADFFQENFFPAPVESDLEPHGILYAVKDVPGYEPRAYYSPEARVGIVFNTAYYGQVRSLALGMAAQLAERTSGLHSVHAAALDFDGRGLLMIAAPGAGRTTHMAALLAAPTRAWSRPTRSSCATRAARRCATCRSASSTCRRTSSGTSHAPPTSSRTASSRTWPSGARTATTTPAPTRTSATSTAASATASRPTRSAGRCSTPTGSADRRATPAAPACAGSCSCAATRSAPPSSGPRRRRPCGCSSRASRAPRPQRRRCPGSTPTCSAPAPSGTT